MQSVSAPEVGLLPCSVMAARRALHGMIGIEPLFHFIALVWFIGNAQGTCQHQESFAMATPPGSVTPEEEEKDEEREQEAQAVHGGRGAARRAGRLARNSRAGQAIHRAA